MPDLTTSADIDALLAAASNTTIRSIPGSEIGVDVQAFSSVLAATTASFLTADETKLDGIETAADVTDTANVTSAGALMDSELASIADVKALDQSVVSGAAPTFAGTNLTGTAGSLTTGITNALKSATTTVNVSSATAPTSGQVLKATSSTAATWQAESGGAPEGTAVLSTGEVGGTKFLREDGDGTCSWQSAAGSGDVVGPASAVDDRIATFDTTTGKLIQDGGQTIAQVEASTSNVTAAGALMDSELASIADVKALDQSVVSGATPTFTNTNFTEATNKNYVTDAQQTVIGNTSNTNTGDEVAASATVAGVAELATIAEVDTGTDTVRTITPAGLAGSALQTKADSVETNADVTDTANVTSAGALMDSELASIADVKALDQSVVSGAAPTFTNTNFTEATDKNYVTDAQQTVIGNTSNTNTGDEAAASATVSGISELATIAEIDTGTDTGRTITPAGLAGSALKTTADAALPKAGGTMTGDITLGENASVALDPAGSADGKYTGITVTGTGGATIAFGDVVVLDVTDSRWELADISVAAAATGDARALMGIAVTSSTDSNPITVLLNGIVRADANFPTLTVSAPVYASTTGDVIVTQPTTTDYVIRNIGQALTANEFYFNPDNFWTTHT